MNKKRFKILMLLAGVLLCGVRGAGEVFADDAPNSTMTVSPTYQKIVLIPGEKYRGTILVSNVDGAQQDLQYGAFVGSFSQSGSEESVDDYENVDTVAQSSYNQIMDWIVLDKDSGSVAPNSSEALGFTINVPENAPAGGQYATIIVRNDTGNTVDNVGNVAIQNVFQFASIIYAEVAGETREEGKIIDNSIPGFIMSSPLETTTMVENDGNVHTDAKYTLQVWPLFSDEEICTNEENPKTGLILPETRKYVKQSCNLPMVGIFRAKQVVKIFGETSIVEKTVFVCPLWLLFVILFVIIALIFFFVARARAHKKAAKRSGGA